MSKLFSGFGALMAAVIGSGAPAHHPNPSHTSPPAASTTSTASSISGTPAVQDYSGRTTVRIQLQSMPAGTVDLSLDQAASRIVARLAVIGLTPGSSHRIALFQGHVGGRPSVAFPDVTADAGGELTQTVSGQVADVQGGIPADPFFQIDQGPTRGNDGGQNPVVGVAHTRLAPRTPHHTTLAVAGVMARNGLATLSYDREANTLSVRVNATGLQPNTRHALHIHSGSCQVQGPVVYSIPDLVAGPGGSATSMITIRRVMSPTLSQGWYVNVHEGDMNQILVNGKPGLLFQPVLCGNVGA